MAGPECRAPPTVCGATYSQVMQSLLLLGVAVALALSGCGNQSPVASDNVDRAEGSGPVATPGEASPFTALFQQDSGEREQGVQEFREVGVVLRPAPQSASPAVSKSQALEAIRADGLGNNLQAPRATLKLLTKALPSFATGEPIDNALAWDVVFPNAPSRVHQPNYRSGSQAQVEGAPCDLHVIVDAQTGVVLEGFQVDCRIVPIDQN